MTTTKQFTFYKDNLKDGEFSLSIDEIKEKYLAWLKTKDIEWVQYYGHQTVANWVMDKEGLSSVPEKSEDLRELSELLMEVRQTLY